MTDRKKTGIGFGITAGVFALFAVVNISLEVTPEWVSQVVGLVSLVAGFFGFKTVYPDAE